MKEKHLVTNGLMDPMMRGALRNGCLLRSYQAEALRTIYIAVRKRRGGCYTVTFPRQSGKNETQAQLESAVMAANRHRGGAIIKLLPTEKNQGEVSRKRLEGVLRGEDGQNAGNIRSLKTKTVCGPTEVRYLSAGRGSAIVGATADLMLEVDEAQMVPPEKYDREAAPMAAANNAVQVFWGTVWDDRTLLARQSRLALKEEEQNGIRHFFRTTAAEVAKEVPEYSAFLQGQIEGLGREHPAVRTQFFCEEISALTGMFTPERCSQMRGDHLPHKEPVRDSSYVFLIDIAGADEMSLRDKQNYGFSDRRDATVLTICSVSLPENESGSMGRPEPVWRVAARRYYRNMPADMLQEAVSQEVRFWDPVRIVLDHTGLGCMLSEYLDHAFPGICRSYDITPAVKTKMAWGFLAMVNTGRWLEYHVDELEPLHSPCKPGRDAWELLTDPALLQQMFFRELQACRLEPGANSQTVRWGVPKGTRDPATGRYIHDDLVMSAALAALCGDDLPINYYTEKDLERWEQGLIEANRVQDREMWQRYRIGPWEIL